MSVASIYFMLFMFWFYFQTFFFETIQVRNKGTMTVTNQERIREFRGTSMQVFGGGTFTAVNLHVHVKNFVIDALATVGATLQGENFVYDGRLFPLYSSQSIEAGFTAKP